MRALTRALVLSVLAACATAGSAEDLPLRGDEQTEQERSAVAELARTFTNEEASTDPVPTSEEVFNPLAPSLTRSPRDTLTDFLQRMQAARRRVGEAVPKFLGSDRLFPTEEMLNAVAETRMMSEIATRALEFERVPMALESFEYRSRMALTLQDLLERVGIPATTDIPDAAQMAAMEETRWQVPGTEIEIRRISRGPRAGEWLFSAETIQRLPEWHRRIANMRRGTDDSESILDIYKYGPLGLSDIVPLRWMLGLPSWMKATIADQPMWRWSALVVLAASCALILTLLQRMLRPLRTSAGGSGAGALWLDMVIPVALAALIMLVREAATHRLRFTEPVYAPMMITLSSMLYLTVVWIIWTSGRAIAETVIVSSRLKTSSIDGQLIRLALRFLALVLSVALLVEGANRIGLPAYSVVAGLGVGGIAVALAARDSLANLMGSFTIMIEKPFRIGHWIKMGDVEGTVESVGFRTTRIRTFYESLISVPSSLLVTSTVDNMGERRFRRVKTTISITYDTRRETLHAFVEALRELIAAHPHTRHDNYHVCLEEFGDSGLQILLYFYLDVPDWATELRQREDVLLRVMECAERLGVKFAFPTRTIHIDSAPPPTHLPQ